MDGLPPFFLHSMTTGPAKPQRSWRLPAIIVGVLCLGVGLYLQRPRPREYDGKPVSDWLQDLDKDKSADTQSRAREAFRKMGTNALSELLETLRSRGAGARQKQVATASQQTLIHQARALKAFEAIGPQAIPALAPLLPSETGLAAARALSHVGAAAVPVLIHALTNSTARVKQTVELGLDAAGEHALALVPVLVHNLKDADSLVRAHAAIALGRINQDPAMAVPALAESLRDPDEEVRLFAAEALGEFGPRAAAALPTLLQVSHDSDNRVYRAIFTSVKRIDPEAAQRAGVK